MKTSENPNPPPYSRILLLLGAGASVEADAPTVEQLVDRFEPYLAKQAPAQTVLDAYRNLVEALQQYEPVASGRAIIDVELLMTALTELAGRAEIPLAAFVSNWKRMVRGTDWQGLLLLLQEHVRVECTVSRDAVDYLRPLGDFVRALGSLDVFTLNYDVAVELAMGLEGHKLSDGFDSHWNPALLSQGSYAVRLFKLHGSLLWFATSDDPAELVKIPVKTSPELPEYVSGQTVQHNVIYPVLTKEQHVEPYATLMNHFREALSAADVLVGIGCSFRDTYLKQVVVERMRQNRRLRLLVVDPKASDVVCRSDDMTDSRWSFASLSDRISVQPSTTGEALAGGALLDHALRLSSAADAEDRHIRESLRAGQGTDETSPYLQLLIDLRMAGELRRGLYQRVAHDKLRGALDRLIRQTNPEATRTASLIVPAVLLYFIDKSRYVNIRAWLEGVLMHGLRYVSYRDEHGDFRAFRGSRLPNDGAFGETQEDFRKFFERRADALAHWIPELHLWQAAFPIGMTTAEVSLCRGVIAALMDAKRFFECASNVSDARWYSSRRENISMPFPNDVEALGIMSGHFRDGKLATLL